VVIYRATDPDDLAAVGYLQESTTRTLAMLENQPGFRLGYWGLDPDEGTMAAVTYWNSQEAIEAAGEQLNKLREERAAHGITVESIQNVQLFTVSAIGTRGSEEKAEEPKHRHRWQHWHA
jgi:heme-degrading monooxygenase HmoA